MSTIKEFYIDKEKRELINTISSAKYISEDQKEAIIEIFGFSDAEKAKKKSEKEKEEREKDFKKNTRKEQHVGKKGRGEQAGLSDFQGKFKTEQKTKGANAPFTHEGKKFTTDVVGDKPQREQIDTFVGAWKGGLIKGKPKLAKRGWK